MRRVIFRVTPAEGRIWRVEREQPGHFGHTTDVTCVARWPKKSQAVSDARDRARSWSVTEPSQLVVHRRDGTIEFECTYPRSSDPRPKSGSQRNRG